MLMLIEAMMKLLNVVCLGVSGVSDHSEEE